MSSITAQQAKLDLELVPKEKRLEIGKCNGRLNPRKIQREPTFQVVLDALALTPCYSAFLITADVPEVYMHQFWDSVYKHDTFYRFKMDKRKRFKLNLEIFRDIFKICPRVQGQDFDALPTDEEIVSFLRELGHTREINSLNDVVVDQMHQPWRTFAALINRSLSGKTTGLDKLRLSRAQILWGMYHQKNVDYVELLWEDFIYQIDNRAYKKQEKIFVFAKEATQIYGVVLPESLTSPEIKETKAYKTYLGFDTRATPPKKVRKFKKPASPQLSIVPVSPEEPTGKSKRVKRPTKKSTNAPARDVVIRETPEMPLSKKKEKMTVKKRKGINLLSKVALTKEAQYEEVKMKSLRDFHKTHPSGSGTVTKTTPSAAKIKPYVTNEGNGVKLGVPDVTEEESSKRDDEEEVKDEFVKTPSNNSDDEDETKITDKAEGDEDEEMDYTTIYSTVIPQSLPSFTPPPQQSTSTPPPTTKVTNPQSALPNFASVFQFNNRVTALEKDVSELKKDDPLKTQVTALVDEHLDARLGATRDEFMNYLLASITARITKHVKNQLPQILPKEVSNFAPPVIQSMVTESLEHAVLAKESYQPQSSYEAAASLTKFTSRKDKDEDEDPFTGSDRGLKKKKTSKDTEPTKCPKAKES
ncbi:hypothetical protein Tco_1199378 [Tanacetum coccineum]